MELFSARRLAHLTNGIWQDDEALSLAGVIISSIGAAEGNGHLLLNNKFYALRYDAERCQFELIMRQMPTPEKLCFLWELVGIAAATAKVFRSEHLFLMHGALLETAPGKAVFLCGPSGVGKTTTAMRWKASGRTVGADDMVLLEYSPAEVIAHPMPTWSRLLKNPDSLEQEKVDFSRCWTVTNLLGLARGEDKQEIREVSFESYFLKIYAACSIFEFILVEKLPLTLRKIAARELCAKAEMLVGRFLHRTLFAHLEGNLEETLKGL